MAYPERELAEHITQCATCQAKGQCREAADIIERAAVAHVEAMFRIPVKPPAKN